MSRNFLSAGFLSDITMRNLILYLPAFLILAVCCNKEYDVPVPSFGSDSVLTGTSPLDPAAKPLMEGIYRITTTSEMFGDTVVVKWNRKSLSFACCNGIYFVLNAGSHNADITLEGYWRNGYNDATGLSRLTIANNEGGNEIIGEIPTQKIIMRGEYGNGEGTPDQSMTLEYLRPFSDKVKYNKFGILAHRAGGRTSDKLPVSENSIEMINFCEKLGSTGIEVDVRLTSDKVAFLYHDADINTRLTQKGPLAGEIKAYTWSQLSSYVRLIKGEKIPTLESALTFVIDSTNLTAVYLDMKEDKEAMAVVIPIQQKMLKRAHDKGRNVTIVAGIPSISVLNDFMTYPDYQNIPSLCELSVDDVRMANSIVWAPRWTLGTQNDLVSQMHSEGRAAICWTIDNPAWIREYINNGLFDGLLTNFPSVVTYYHYIQK
jgi:glycerophosphoryl diester phosphodiesterase